MPKELEEQLMDMPWPPVVKIGTEENPEEVTLTDLDVTWALCTLLGMKWHDATAVTDDLHKRFLYNKAMQVAQQQSEATREVEAKRKEYENKIDEQLSNLANQANLTQDNIAAQTVPPPSL